MSYLKNFAFLLLVVSLIAGCADPENDAKLQGFTSDLLKAFSDADTESLGALGEATFRQGEPDAPAELSDVISSLEDIRRKLRGLEFEIYQHSNVERPTIDQIRHSELDHQLLMDRLKSIVKEIKSAKEKAVPSDKTQPSEASPAAVEMAIKVFAIELSKAEGEQKANDSVKDIRSKFDAVQQRYAEGSVTPDEVDASLKKLKQELFLMNP